MPQQARAVDVARRAGVSRTAVSFVLNGQSVGNISEATRQRVLQAAAELGCQPNRVAQSLRRRRTEALGLVTDSIASSPFAGRILAGAMERAGADGYVVLAYDSHDHPDREQAAVEELQRRQVDGLVYATMGYRELHAAPTASVPVVLANCTAGSEDETSVAPDDAAGARTAVQHLIGLGHRRVAMLTGGWDPVVSPATGNVAGHRQRHRSDPRRRLPSGMCCGGSGRHRRPGRGHRVGDRRRLPRRIPAVAAGRPAERRVRGD